MADASGMTPAPAQEKPAKEKKPFKLWTITDVVGLDRKGWEIVQHSATWVAAAASLLNLALVVVFACAIASKSHFGLLDDAPEAWKFVVWLILTITATGIAAVLQLCTDFGLAWSAGLAGEKYRVSPTTLIVVWLMCLVTTLYMKFDLYSSWAHERGAVLVQAQTEEANDKRILAKFPSAAPPSVDASQRVIDASPGQLTDLRAERQRLIAARDQEKQYLGNTAHGMGPAWNKLNDQVLEYDAKIATEVKTAADADVAKQDRIDYDAAKSRQEANAKVTANDGATLKLLYDHPFVIFLRVVGGALVSIVGVLVALAARKKLEEKRVEEEARAKASERGKKAWDTRRNSPREADFTESAALDSRAIPDLGPVEAGQVSEADTHRIVRPDTDRHPDLSGDDFGAKASGYGGDTGDVTDAAAEPQGDDGEPPADGAGGRVGG